jgi:predicted amidohydrolase YtcJ
MTNLLLTNGKIYTTNPTRPRAHAIAFASGRVVAFDDDALSARTARTQEVDLGGRAVIPGLVDHHIHFASYAIGMARVQLDGARSVEDALARVAERVKTANPGEWIFGRGWNHLDWMIPAFPTKAPLDAIAPNNPVVLDRKDGHSTWLNSAALHKVNITRDTPDPAGGKIDRDARGEPTGLLRENAMDLLHDKRAFFTSHISDAVLLNAIRAAHQLGITGIHNVEGAVSLRAFQSLRAQDRLTLRVIHTLPAENLERALDIGLCGGLGDEFLRIGGVKMFADGSLGSQTAWMLEPFVGHPANYGMPTTPAAEIERLARLAASAGMMVCTHAIGDQANRQVLNVYEKLRREELGVPLRIEHAQHLHPTDIPRFAALNVIASMQPIHATSDYKMADALLGARARGAYVFKSLLNTDARLAFGSDCPVETLDPWVGIHAAVTRERANGEPRGGWYPEEKLSVAEAVNAYVGAPLREGGLGDALVLAQDVFQVLPREILNTRTEYTIVGGKVVYPA